MNLVRCRGRPGAGRFATGALVAFAMAAGGPAAGQMAGGAVSGRVVDSAGRPVESAGVLVVDAPGHEARTGADGWFLLDSIPPGRWSLIVRRIGFAPVRLAVEVGPSRLELGDVAMTAAPFRLAEIAVTGVRAAKPAFHLAHLPDALRRLELTYSAAGRAEHLPAGASLTPDGVMAVLARYRDRTQVQVVQTDETIGHLRGGVNRGGCALTRALSTKLEYDSGEPALVSLVDPDGAMWDLRLHGLASVNLCHRSETLVLSGRGLAAAPTARGWAVAVAEGQEVTLNLVDGVGRLLGSAPISGPLGFLAADSLRLAPTPRGVTVASGAWPFGWTEVDTRGEVRLVGDPLSGEEGAAAMARFRDWIGYAVLPIQGGYIQTLERPDRVDHAHLLYDAAGRLVSTSVGNLPLFVASPMAGRRRLLAIWYRDAARRRTEVRLYAY